MSAARALPRALRAGTDPRRPLHATRLLHVTGAELVHTRVAHLAALLEPGDLLVLNDAATLPASLRGTVAGAPIEARIAGAEGRADFPRRMRLVLFGPGDWRQDTDARPAPPPVAAGAELRFDGFGATVVARSAISPRLVEVAFDREGDALAEAIYAHGRPVQYRHLRAPLTLGQIQTPYARRPWAVEMPSTGRPLSWDLLEELRARGIDHVFLTHAAGLSATGDPALDRALPLPERFEIPALTAARIASTRRRGGRIVAAGTTVVRALESASAGGALRPGLGVATSRLRPGHTLRSVDAILTGMHSPGESHYDLLGAFAAGSVLDQAHSAASRCGYLAHELGDLMLVDKSPHP